MYQQFQSNPYWQGFWRGLRPDPVYNLDQWADNFRFLSQRSAAEPGRWRTNRTPYLREIMRELSVHSHTQQIIFMKGAQIGGPLSLDTIVPTPTGFTTMGKIKVGDKVFDEKGIVRTVRGVSPVFKNERCYEIKFDDHATVRCDWRHLWKVERDNFKGKFTALTCTTEDMRLDFRERGRNRYRIPVADYLQLSAKNLIAAPYTLGVWLGNGNRHSNRVSSFAPDAAHIAAKIESEGYTTLLNAKWSKGNSTEIIINPKGRTHRRTKKFFGTELRELGVWKNKNIPVNYLRGDFSQRLSLLQGLMDTDGYCTKKGLCEFYSTNKGMAEATQNLVCSLGMRARLVVKPPNHNSTYGANLSVWCVRFTAYKNIPVFSVLRKLNRLKDSGRSNQTGYRRIESIKPIKSFPTKCISVSGPSKLFLIGREMIPTHNTEIGLNWVGYTIDHVPGPMLAVQPTVDLARRFSKQRIEPLIEESPRLRAKIRPAKERDSGNTMFSKEFPGGILLITGANSAVGLRSMPARFLFLDEVDAYPQNVDDEGSPIQLAEARTRTYRRNRKIFLVSTPTIQGRSNIERAYESSDKRRYYVPCPICQFKQPLEWKQMRWKDADYKTTTYECVECKKEIDERWKTQMLNRGEWIAENPECKNKKIAGFHLNSLYSPLGWYSWQDAVKDWLEAQGKPDQLRTFVNTVLGEVWVEKGDAPDWRRLYERREHYEINKIPEKVAFLTAGVDVQKDRLEAQIVGWAKGKESWVIDYRVFPGDTSDLSQMGPWQGVRNLLQESWQRTDTASLPLRLVAIDSGYNTQSVYDFVRRYPANRVIATKGEDNSQILISAPSAVDVFANGRRIRRGLKIWKLGVSLAKSELYGLLKMEKPTDTELEVYGYPPGFVHFPELNEDYFKQLTAEQLTRKLIKGFTKYDWVKVYERNEALDTFILARAAAALVGIDRFTDEQWAQMRNFAAPLQEKSPENAPAIAGNQGENTENKPRSEIKRRKSSFW